MLRNALKDSWLNEGVGILIPERGGISSRVHCVPSICEDNKASFRTHMEIKRSIIATSTQS